MFYPRLYVLPHVDGQPLQGYSNHDAAEVLQWLIWQLLFDIYSFTPGYMFYPSLYVLPQVDGQPLQGYSNHDAVEVLRNTGTVVNLKLARYQHGAKFEKLQQYLGKSY